MEQDHLVLEDTICENKSPGDMDSWVLERSTLLEQISHYKSRAEELDAQVAELVESNEKARLKSRSIISAQSETISSQELSILTKDKEINEYQSQISALREQLLQAQSVSERHYESTSQLLALEDSTRVVNQLQAEIRASKVRISELELDLLESQASLARLRSENSSSSSLMSLYKQEKDSLFQENLKLREDLEGSRQLEKSLRESNESQARELESFSNRSALETSIINEALQKTISVCRVRENEVIRLRFRLFKSEGETNEARSRLEKSMLALSTARVLLRRHNIPIECGQIDDVIRGSRRGPLHTARPSDRRTASETPQQHQEPQSESQAISLLNSVVVGLRSELDAKNAEIEDLTRELNAGADDLARKDDEIRVLTDAAALAERTAREFAELVREQAHTISIHNDLLVVAGRAKAAMDSAGLWDQGLAAYLPVSSASSLSPGSNVASSPDQESSVSSVNHADLGKAHRLEIDEELRRARLTNEELLQLVRNPPARGGGFTPSPFPTTFTMTPRVGLNGHVESASELGTLLAREFRLAPLLQQLHSLVGSKSSSASSRVSSPSANSTSPTGPGSVQNRVHNVARGLVQMANALACALEALSAVSARVTRSEAAEQAAQVRAVTAERTAQAAAESKRRLLVLLGRFLAQSGSVERVDERNSNDLVESHPDSSKGAPGVSDGAYTSEAAAEEGQLQLELCSERLELPALNLEDSHLDDEDISTFLVSLRMSLAARAHARRLVRLTSEEMETVRKNRDIHYRRFRYLPASNASVNPTHISNMPYYSNSINSKASAPGNVSHSISSNSALRYPPTNGGNSLSAGATRDNEDPTVPPLLVYMGSVRLARNVIGDAGVRSISAFLTRLAVGVRADGSACTSSSADSSFDSKADFHCVCKLRVGSVDLRQNYISDSAARVVSGEKILRVFSSTSGGALGNVTPSNLPQSRPSSAAGSYELVLDMSGRESDSSEDQSSLCILDLRMQRSPDNSSLSDSQPAQIPSLVARSSVSEKYTTPGPSRRTSTVGNIQTYNIIASLDSDGGSAVGGAKGPSFYYIMKPSTISAAECGPVQPVVPIMGILSETTDISSIKLGVVSSNRNMGVGGGASAVRAKKASTYNILKNPSLKSS